MVNKFLKGSRYFKYNEETDSIICYRILGFQNESTLKVVNIYTKEKTKINKEELVDDYYLLKPDGYLHFNIVTIPNVSNSNKTNYDVVVLLYTKDDLSVPYAVCRQNTAGFHANMIQRSDSVIRGFSISVDTLPGNLTIQQFTACNSLIHTESIAVYIDDKLDDLLSSIKTKEFDRTLDGIWSDFLNTLNNSDRAYVQTFDNYLGYCRTLRDLLEYNDFMDDFVSAFDVMKLDTNIEVNEYNQINQEALDKLNFELGKDISEYICIEYDKDIRLDDIKENYVLICGFDYKIYLVKYKLSSYLDNLNTSRLTPQDKLNIINKLTNR